MAISKKNSGCNDDVSTSRTTVKVEWEDENVKHTIEFDDLSEKDSIKTALKFCISGGNVSAEIILPKKND